MKPAAEEVKAIKEKLENQLAALKPDASVYQSTDISFMRIEN